MDKEKEYFLYGMMSTREGFNGECMFTHLCKPSLEYTLAEFVEMVEKDSELKEKVDRLYKKANESIEGVSNGQGY